METIDDWFGEYLETFAACGRGERDARALLGYWGVPLLIPTDDGLIALTTEDQVVSAAQQQIEGMRLAEYDHSDVLGLDVTALNSSSSLVRAEFSWRRADGTEIGRPTVTYLVTSGSAGRRISALVPHQRK